MIRKWKATLLLSALFFASCGNKTEQINLQSQDQPAYLSVCQISSRIGELDGKIIQIKGDLEGFHDLRLTSENCSELAIYVAFDGLQVQELLKDRKNLSVSLIKGELVVEGMVKKDGRRVLDGVDIIDSKTGNIETKLGYRTVNSLEEPRIISFRQKFDE